MKLADVPPQLLAVRCLRCDDYLAIDPQASPAERNAIATEHHLYLCTVPTPNVALWRSIGFPSPGPHLRRG